MPFYMRDNILYPYMIYYRSVYIFMGMEQKSLAMFRSVQKFHYWKSPTCIGYEEIWVTRKGGPVVVSFTPLAKKG